MDKHEIVVDVAGGYAGRVRLTCTTCLATLVRQPYMEDEQWDALRLAFIERHGGLQERQDD